MTSVGFLSNKEIDITSSEQYRCISYGITTGREVSSVNEKGLETSYRRL